MPGGGEGAGGGAAAAAGVAGGPLESYRRWYLANAAWLVRFLLPPLPPPFRSRPSLPNFALLCQYITY